MHTELCKPWTFVVLLITCVGMVNPAEGNGVHASHDATEDFESLLDLPIEELMQVEITGASLTPKSVITAPSSVTVFDRERIQELGVDKLHELINYIPGFQSYLSSSWSHSYPISVRGRRISSGTSEILLLIDGQRINNPRTGGSGVVLPTFPLSQIERVEFIRGPGASIYGSNAMMGVINIITRKEANEVHVGYGTYERKTADLALSKRIGNLDVSVLAHHDSDDGEDYTVLSNNKRLPVAMKDQKSYKDIIVNVQLNDTRFNLQYYDLNSTGYFAEGSTPNQDNVRDGDLLTLQLTQGFEWFSVKSDITIEYQTSDATIHGQVEEAGVFNFISNPPSNDPLMSDVQFNNVEGYRAFWLNDWQVSDTQSVQFGSEYRYLNIPSAYTLSNFDIAALAIQDFPIESSDTLSIRTEVQEDTDRDIFGVFGQYQLELGDATQLTLGARYDNYASIGSELSPRISLIHALNNNHSLKLLYGQAFRAPSENELFLVNNPVMIGNPDLESETVTTWEAIWLAQWERTFLSFGYFKNQFKDSIMLTQILNNRIQFQNVHLDDTHGVEFELHHHLNNQWSARTALMHLFNNAEQSFREARTMGSVTINYASNQWSSSLSSVYHGTRETQLRAATERTQLDSYWLMNGKLAYQWNDQWTYDLQVKNLLDKEYDTPNSHVAMNNPVPNRGREFLASLTFQF